MTKTMPTIQCPVCGYHNRAGAHFCHQCGASLIGHNHTPASPPTSPATTRRFSSDTSSPVPPPADTRPLAQATAGFAPLPEGALLKGGRYIVTEVHATNERMNTYVITDSQATRSCPNCKTQSTDLGEQFCSTCGADLSSVKPIHMRYMVQESADAQLFTVEAHLLEMNLAHPGLLLPYETFVEAPYGPPRYYLVEPEFLPSLASRFPVPQELSRVLTWGVSLAQALDYLHTHRVVVRDINLNRIAIEEKAARWIHLNAAYIIPPEVDASGHYAQDVQGLVAVLLYLATGQQQPYHPLLPKRLSALFAQALATPPTLSAASLAAELTAALEDVRHPGSIAWSVGYRTDVGQVRSLNEDSLLVLDMATVVRSRNKPLGIFVVADGMGGHEAGDVASRITVQTIAREAVEQLFAPMMAGESLPDARQWISAAVQSANHAVYQQRKAAGTDMGCTLVMTLMAGERAIIANVGDSRAYLLDPDGITQITTDHSLVERLVATGQITAEEALHHPQKNVIYRVIGDRPKVEVDRFEQRLRDGTALLLCSDGLSGMVSDDHIWHIWRTSTSPQEACNRLVEAANQAGGEDNITVIIVQLFT